MSASPPVYEETTRSTSQPSSSISSQLPTWHANRGDRSFASALVPRWNTQKYGEELTKNPFKLFGMVSPFGWAMFFRSVGLPLLPIYSPSSRASLIGWTSGWFAWTCDGYDYFAVSLTLKLLAAQFKVDTAKITTAITLTLLFRSLGALIFGALADRFGRKWTLVANLCLIAVFELGTGFCNTYHQFLAVRALFGVAMGGVWWAL